MNDWTGSGQQRRPQGTCSPPVGRKTKPPTLKAGTRILVRLPNQATWRQHVTKQNIPVENVERRFDGRTMFRHGDYTVIADNKAIY